jgi:hypothetical protein
LYLWDIVASHDHDDNAAHIWAEGKMFTAGLDLKASMQDFSGNGENESHAQQSLKIFKHLQELQKNLLSINKCNKVQ